jgi:sterol 24-C-methyltransferase
MSSTGIKHSDGRVNDRIQNYTKFWNADPLKEQETDNTKRLDSYADVANGQFHLSFELSCFMVTLGYYDGATELYEYGWSQSFHFSRFYKGEAFLASLARHEHYLASQMVLRPGMRVLDVGCGVGGPAREIAQFTDAQIVGLNNNDFQIGRARKYVKAAGLENQVTFVKGDFMKLSEQFGENSFDAGSFFSLPLLVCSCLSSIKFQFMPSRPLFMLRLGKASMVKFSRS